MATPSSILPGGFPWTEEPGRLQDYSSWGHRESDMTEVNLPLLPQTHTHGNLGESTLIVQNAKSNTRIVDLVYFTCGFVSEEEVYF